MLQIYVYGTLEEGFLDLTADTSLNMESLADIFDEDLSIGEYSLPVDIPWTANNRRLLGFAERIENFSQKTNWWRCIVYDNMFPELPNAKLTLLEKIGTWTYNKGKFSATISGAKGVYGSLIKGKKLTDLSLGGTIAWAGIESRKFAEGVMKGTIQQYNYLSFAPVAIENFFDTGRPDYDKEFLAKDTVNTVINSGGSADNWVFGRPTAANPAIATNIGDTEHIDYRTVPFFNLKYVFKKAFEEFGFTVSGAFVDSADFNDLYLFNQCGIENYIAGTFQDFNRAIIPSNHVPSIDIAIFVKAVCDAFCLFPSFKNTNQVVFTYRKINLTSNRQIMSLNDVCFRDFDSTLQDPSATDTGSGYKIDYTWDSNDQYYSDRVKDLKDKTVAGTVATAADLATFNIGRQLTTNDIVYVSAENLYYCVADATASPIKWDAYAENLNAFTEGDAQRSVEVALSTLCTYVEFNPSTALYERRNYVGCRQMGSYINNKGVKVVNDFGLRIFYIKKQNIDGANIPTSFNFNRDVNNTKIEPYSLAWQGADGLVANFHALWQSVQENMEIVKTTIRTDQKVLTEMNAANCYEINNVLFIANKIERTIPLKNSLVLSIVPL